MRLNTGIVRYTGTYVERHFQKPHVASYTYKKLASRTLLRFSSVVAPFFLPIWHRFSDALPVVPLGSADIIYQVFTDMLKLILRQVCCVLDWAFSKERIERLDTGFMSCTMASPCHELSWQLVAEPWSIVPLCPCVIERLERTARINHRYVRYD
jgi:hypothetical protein